VPSRSPSVPVPRTFALAFCPPLSELPPRLRSCTCSLLLSVYSCHIHYSLCHGVPVHRVCKQTKTSRESDGDERDGEQSETRNSMRIRWRVLLSSFISFPLIGRNEKSACFVYKRRIICDFVCVCVCVCVCVENDILRQKRRKACSQHPFYRLLCCGFCYLKTLENIRYRRYKISIQYYLFINAAFILCRLSKAFVDTCKGHCYVISLLEYYMILDFLRFSK